MKLQPSGAAGGDMLAPVEPVECGPVLLCMQVGFGVGAGGTLPTRPRHRHRAAPQSALRTETRRRAA